MKKIFLMLIPALLFSCSKPVPDNHAKLEQLAERTCKAIDYRKQRFACADQIRFTQDTLNHTKNPVDTARLQTKLRGLLKQKAAILKETFAMADTIKKQLDSLMPFTDKAAQNKFTAQLDSLLAKKGCKDETKGVPNE